MEVVILAPDETLLCCWQTVSGYAVVGVEGIQQGAQNASLWDTGPGSDVLNTHLPTLTTWGLSERKSSTHLHSWVFSPKSLGSQY